MRYTKRMSWFGISDIIYLIVAITVQIKRYEGAKPDPRYYSQSQILFPKDGTIFSECHEMQGIIRKEKHLHIWVDIKYGAIQREESPFFPFDGERDYTTLTYRFSCKNGKFSVKTDILHGSHLSFYGANHDTFDKILLHKRIHH